jgi:hypothetical protein
MKLGITILGLAARLARRRIEHSREAAIREALEAIASRRRASAEISAPPRADLPPTGTTNSQNGS